MVKVQCDYCGSIHDTLWRDYYVRKDYGKYACTNCRLKKAQETTLELRRNDLYSRAKEFCDENHYIILTPKEEIYNSNSRVDYLCPEHGIHNVKIYSLITKHKCIDCIHKSHSDNNRLPIEEVCLYFEEHGSKLLNPNDYTRSIDKNLRVICPECGGEFITSHFSFKKYDGQRCPDCANAESQGEHKIRQYLESHNIHFIPQYRFKDCRTSVPLPFDFYLTELNIAIEYDGAGHYIPIKRGKMTTEDAEKNLKQIQYRDDIKTHYCNEKEIKLIRIPYTDFNNIENVLDRHLINLHEDIV